ncbi:MAG: hypothetical protein IPQ03_07955 [Bacteroidetes bacterium]|nr:hypothetical protein [Bacteroidota bacterium]
MYQLWKNWYRQLHWTRKWFPIFVLIRPLVDNFFWLKEISPLLSPLTIVGVLTPLLCLVSFNNPRMPGKIRNSVDSLMSSYGAVVLINCFVVLIYHFSVEFFGESIKFITPTLLFLYARRFIQSKEDLIFILYTFLLSCSIPLAIFGYELIFGPIRPTYLSEGRGGGSRIRGQYGDIMSYAVYITGALLIYMYMYIDGMYSRWWIGKKNHIHKNDGGVSGVFTRINFDQTCVFMERIYFSLRSDGRVQFQKIQKFDRDIFSFGFIAADFRTAVIQITD